MITHKVNFIKIPDDNGVLKSSFSGIEIISTKGHIRQMYKITTNMFEKAIEENTKIIELIELIERSEQDNGYL